MSNSTSLFRAAEEIPHDKSREKNFIKDFLIGTGSGLAAVPFIQFQLYFKNLAQNLDSTKTQTSASKIFLQNLKNEVKTEKSIAKPLFRNIRVLYRGGGGFAASFVPTIALQTTVKGLSPKNLNPVIAGFFGGVASAFVVCPAELIMNQQQKIGKNFWSSVKLIHSSVGAKGFYRGLVATGIREGNFAAAYLGATPLLKKEFVDRGCNEKAAHLIAGTTSGIGAVALTQTADTHKTQVQRDLFLKQVMSKTLFSRAGFIGFGWRASLTTTAILVMSFVQEKIKEKWRK